MEKDEQLVENKLSGLCATFSHFVRFCRGDQKSLINILPYVPMSNLEIKSESKLFHFEFAFQIRVDVVKIVERLSNFQKCISTLFN